MTKQEKSEMTDGRSRRGLGLFAVVAVLSMLGIVLWLVVSGNDDPS